MVFHIAQVGDFVCYLHVTKKQYFIVYLIYGISCILCAAGSINITNISTGKCLAKIDARKTRLLKECNCSGRRCNLSRWIQATEITSTVEQALEGITALFYDQELNEIYTGNEAGLLHVWSS